MTQLVLLVSRERKHEGDVFRQYSPVKETFYFGFVDGRELELDSLKICIPTGGRHVFCSEYFEGRQFSFIGENISLVFYYPSLLKAMRATVERVLPIHDQPALEIIIGNEELVRWLEEQANCFRGKYLDVYHGATRLLVGFTVMNFPLLEKRLKERRDKLFRQLADLLQGIRESKKWIRGDITCGESWRTEWRVRDEKEKLAKSESEKEKLIASACELGATKEEIRNYLMQEFGISQLDSG